MFGVRRPLRFLAERLELNDDQVKVVARILDELKTERAQADVDAQRVLNAFADSVAAASFDEATASAGAQLRVEQAERLKAAVTKALRELHGALTEEQRGRFATLLRTGVVTM
jgi:Spy/CpxP family protein refolding chaperone